MSTETPPPGFVDPYNQTKHGFYGELGSGANARVKFLQTAISCDELDKITLIQNIPGSEAWDVRDLFQRDVDHDRVTRDILPYLKDRDRVKYFNPLTLVLLPLSPGQEVVEKDIRSVEETTITREPHDYIRFEVEDLFRFEAHQSHPAWSSVSWNDRRVKVVAIDGQHRLSALKRWKKEPGGPGDLANWQIPVVLLGIVKDNPEEDAAGVLEVVRKTFIYINSRAEQVNKSRKILLDDESVNSLCVQEIVQASHENDVLPLDQRDSTRLPLLFFDWRGETKGGRPWPAPAMVKSTVEIKDWLEEYILGGDGDEKQEARLETDDLIPPLETDDITRIVTHDDARRIRRQFRRLVYPGLSFLLENFKPYRHYTEEVRKLEADALAESDLARHAFSRLRFGASRADESIQENVLDKYEELVMDLERIKSAFPELVARDIGMRAVIAAFDYLKQFRDNREDQTVDWRVYSEWFTEGVNQVFDDGWFEAFERQVQPKKDLLTHVAFDPSGSIINYKVRDAGVAFGTMLALLVVGKISSGEPSENEDLLGEAWQELAENLRVPLRRGYRKLIRAELKDIFQGTSTEFKAEVNKRADQQVNEHLQEFSDYLNVP